MAILYSYPITETVKTTDQFVLSVAPSAGVGAFQTNSITFETLRDAIYTSLHDGTATYIPVYDTATHTIDSVLKQDSTSAPTSLTVSSGVTLAVTSNATVGGTLGVTGVTTLIGDVGINDATPSYKLDVNGIIRTQNKLIINSTATETYTDAVLEIVRNNASATDAMMFWKDNSLSSSNIMIEVISNSDSGYFFDFYYDLTWVGDIQHDNSAVYYNTASDYRLKENVVNLTGAIDKVKQLQPKEFNFINKPGNTVQGFIAHEVQDIVPQAVTGQKDGVDANGNAKYQGIDQSKLVPLLTAALQEAIARIEALENA